MQRTHKVNLLLAVGLVLVAALHGGLAWIMNETVTNSLVAREAALSRDYMQGIVEGEGGISALFTGAASSQQLKHFARTVEALPGVVRANVYSADRFIRYSTEPNLVGLKFARNDELEETFEGRISARIEEITATPKPEHLGLNKFAGRQFIEAYVPLADATGKTVAVVELYTETEGLTAEVNRIRSIVMVSMLIVSLFTLAVLLGLFRMRR